MTIKDHSCADRCLDYFFERRPEVNLMRVQLGIAAPVNGWAIFNEFFKQQLIGEYGHVQD